MTVAARSDQPSQPAPAVRRGLVARLAARVADAVGSAEARAWGTDTPRPQGS
ncbi:MAG TPA: hypothetical protein VFZ83_05675 [Acidimicrobiia bacterium]|nr:hypothetical protein [Acidimicrobiia bacterium]